MDRAGGAELSLRSHHGEGSPMKKRNLPSNEHFENRNLSYSLTVIQCYDCVATVLAQPKERSLGPGSCDTLPCPEGRGGRGGALTVQRTS